MMIYNDLKLVFYYFIVSPIFLFPLGTFDKYLKWSSKKT